jgi:hypothetical protein
VDSNSLRIYDLELAPTMIRYRMFGVPSPGLMTQELNCSGPSCKLKVVRS